MKPDQVIVRSSSYPSPLELFLDFRLEFHIPSRHILLLARFLWNPSTKVAVVLENTIVAMIPC